MGLGLQATPRSPPNSFLHAPLCFDPASRCRARGTRVVDTVVMRLTRMRQACQASRSSRSPTTSRSWACPMPSRTGTHPWKASGRHTRPGQVGPFQNRHLLVQAGQQLAQVPGHAVQAVLIPVACLGYRRCTRHAVAARGDADLACPCPRAWRGVRRCPALAAAAARAGRRAPA